MNDYEITTIIGKEFPEKVIPLIEQAKSSIFIIVYDWRWYPDQIGSAIQKFNNAIITLSRKGREIRVITNMPYIDGILKQLNIKVHKINSSKIMHTKLMIIDNKIAILGSHNYSMAAFTINYEVSVAIQDEKVVARLKSYFENLWGL